MIPRRFLVLGCAATAVAGQLGCTLNPLGAGGSTPATSTTIGATTSTGSEGGAGGAGGAGETTTVGGLEPPRLVDVGGPVMATPKVIAITYDSDSIQAGIDGFVAAVGSSTYWSTTTSEYGVGPLVALPPIHRTEVAPTNITDHAIVQELEINTQGANPLWGAADPNTHYLFVFPAGTTVDSDGPCCGPGYDAYHGEAVVAGVSISYSVVCECPGYDGPALDLLQSTTAAISHELVEATTDPFTDSNPAYTQTDDAHAVWTLVTGGEAADLCEYLVDPYLQPAGLSYTVQRSWSNAAAAAGDDPCVPADASSAYFKSVPRLGDPVTIDYFGPWTTTGVTIPVGTSKSA